MRRTFTMAVRMAGRMALLALPALLLLLAAPARAQTIEDSRGPHTFDTAPQRIVVLSWSLAEQIIELGVTPAGMADPDGYRKWVVRPGLPDGIADVGLRHEPNLERIAELEPDLILASDDQGALVDKLEMVAPVLHFDTFSAEHDNLAVSKRVFLDLARLLGREDQARRHLDEQEARLAALGDKVRAHFGGSPPPVTVVRFLDASRVAVHGDNAMPVFALEAMGLESAATLPPTTWGITIRRIEELGAIEKGAVLHIEPYAEGEEVFSRPLWQAMPFVRAQRFAAVEPVWTYGGAMSLGYLGEALAAALLSLEPQ